MQNVSKIVSKFWKIKYFLWFPFWYVQSLCDINKIFVENIYNFVFFGY